MPARFEIYQDNAGQYRWKLLASNGEQVAASGEGFASRADAKRAAEAVKKRASEATLPEAERRRTAPKK